MTEPFYLETLNNIPYSAEISLADLVGGYTRAKLLIVGADMYVTVLSGAAALISEGEIVYVNVFERETDAVPKDSVRVTYEELLEHSLQFEKNNIQFEKSTT